MHMAVKRRHRRDNRYEFYGYGAAEDPSAVVEAGDVVAVPAPDDADDQDGAITAPPVGRDLSTIPASIGQQIFAITSGVAGGLAGFVLAYKMANAVRVNTAEVIIASIIAAIGSFGAVFAIRTFH